MPTYDYSCRSCGARFEAWQKMTDDPITICPTCGGPVHRIIYPVGLVFKGSGFYITDNSKSANGSDGHHADAPGGTEKDAAPAAESASDGSADSGSGTSTEAKSVKSETKTASTPAASAASTPATSVKE